MAPLRPPKGVPRYRYIAGTLRERIIKGEKGYQPGDRIPSEPQLRDEFGGVARETVRSAIRLLRDEQLVEVILGDGTYVCPQDEWELED